MPIKKEIKKGDEFGRLTIISELERYVTSGGNKQRQFLCKCKCGNEKKILLQSLLTGATKSCGCLMLEVSVMNGYKTIHGARSEGKTRRGYESWRSMKARCYNFKNHNFKHYGGRGIKVCDRWVHSYKNFFDDMGLRPINRTLDRIDVNANYSPKNCRWATHKEQRANRRINKLEIKTNMNNKTERIELRCTQEQKEKLTKKALKAKKSLSAYVIEKAMCE